MVNNVYGVTLRARDGRERRELVWFPNDQVRQEFYNRARKNGLEVIVNSPDDNAQTLYITRIRARVLHSVITVDFELFCALRCEARGAFFCLCHLVIGSHEWLCVTKVVADSLLHNIVPVKKGFILGG